MKPSIGNSVSWMRAASFVDTNIFVEKYYFMWVLYTNKTFGPNLDGQYLFIQKYTLGILFFIMPILISWMSDIYLIFFIKNTLGFGTMDAKNNV